MYTKLIISYPELNAFINIKPKNKKIIVNDNRNGNVNQFVNSRVNTMGGNNNINMMNPMNGFRQGNMMNNVNQNYNN